MAPKTSGPGLTLSSEQQATNSAVLDQDRSMPSTAPNQSIERAAAVLQAIGASETGSLRSSDVGRAIGLGPSTAGRLLTTLETLGYVHRHRDTQEYSVGTTVLALATQALNHNPVHRESRAAAQELAQRIGLTANVGVLDGNSCIYLCHFEGALAPKSHTMIGMRQPLHASALGKCLMLDLTRDQRRQLLGDTLPTYTEHTITDEAELTANLDAGRSRGWCDENQELALGRFCVAAPIRGATGAIVAALSISGRVSTLRTLDQESITENLIEVADRISVGLGLISAVPH
jgi:IclR family acetate operon transcriptional repressor